MPAFRMQNHDPKKGLNVDERHREALQIRRRWEELGQQLKAFPRGRRLTEEEVERLLVINREQQELLPQLPGWWA
jgi:hypothetical protein